MDNRDIETGGEAALLAPSEIRRGLAAGAPVMLGIMPYALLLGAQAAQKGFSLVEVPLLTGLNFAGGSEFAAVQLWTSPPHLLLIAAVTFLVNSRHLLMGAALAPSIQHLPKQIVFPALYVMTDESWALGLADAQKRSDGCARPAFSLPYYLAVALSFYVVWVTFTTAGAVMGPIIGDVRAFGFDMAFPAVFLVLMRGMWKGIRASRPWVASLVVAAGTHLLVPGAWYVAAGAVSGLITAFLLAERSR